MTLPHGGTGVQLEDEALAVRGPLAPDLPSFLHCRVAAGRPTQRLRRAGSGTFNNDLRASHLLRDATDDDPTAVEPSNQTTSSWSSQTRNIVDLTATLPGLRRLVSPA